MNTSSSAAIGPTNVNYNVVRDSIARTKLSAMDLYMQSKFGNVLFANELARRFGNEGIVSTSLNPGEFISFVLETEC